MNSTFPWWYTTGAQLDRDGAHFRVWTHGRRSVSVLLGDKEHALQQESGSGYFSGFVSGAVAGDLYSFHVDGKGPFPDPASRFQPRGPHGPSQLVDSSKFTWTDKTWGGINIEGQIIYETHVGTF